MAWNGGIMLAVAAHHTSQACPCCGHVAKENRLKQAEFLCVDCGYAENADVVGAIHVLERGQRLLATCRTLGVGSEKAPQRDQFLPDLQAHSSSMGQKAGENAVSIKMGRCGGFAARVPKVRQAVSLWRGRLWLWSPDQNETSLGEAGTH